MRFRDKVRRAKRPVVVYEILPPREKDGTLDSYAEKISSLLSQTHIDAINIPEVHDENERGERPVQNLERVWVDWYLCFHVLLRDGIVAIPARRHARF